ncbi:hypothetical protein JG687_00015186 [Phytophthora cactorum]|uniref:Uncharacterized protein n=1 Tax=Phytophthora cactorum TaxID=29920 RepID=A0A8T1TXL2_9STRA|nr:hypothetical protein JG687_00015186 [Phytophthora cactorum]
MCRNFWRYWKRIILSSTWKLSFQRDMHNTLATSGNTTLHPLIGVSVSRLKPRLHF